jgi:hypothetical protein
MNPKTLTKMILALLAYNGNMTQEKAVELLNKADDAFHDQVLDELSIEQMLDLLNNPEPPQIIETPDTPLILT